MRKLSLSLIAIAMLSAVTVPAQAADPPTTQPCAASTEYASVGLAGAHEDVTPPAVVGVSLVAYFGLDYPAESAARFQYRVDVSGSETSPSAQTADVRLALAWDNETDFDFFVYDAYGEFLAAGNAEQPEIFSDDPLRSGSRESILLQDLPTCSDLRVDVLNAAGVPQAEMTLTTTLEGLQ